MTIQNLEQTPPGETKRGYLVKSGLGSAMGSIWVGRLGYLALRVAISSLCPSCSHQRLHLFTSNTPAQPLPRMLHLLTRNAHAHSARSTPPPTSANKATCPNSAGSSSSGLGCNVHSRRGCSIRRIVSHVQLFPSFLTRISLHVFARYDTQDGVLTV